ncbi:glycosyltransferase family 8 protein [Paracnuella aquatica]|uniref:glycosyltransferase family 8 protein n=1 Tax=Paracnuella aquatica TaxID=2268757 RepID=UPI000DEF4052|nr:glycosyltransferase family 8 protein [Paracnuella aquatica]RPD51605.1 glycosyltransferase family 8 protein [Paracnuella aquatica]
METQDKQIHLALAFDQNFITPFYVLLTSIFENNKESNFALHTIASGVDAAELNEIAAFVQQNNSQIHYYTIDASQVDNFVIPENSHFSPATYYRLFFPALVPKHIEKLLYIDTDTIVIGKLSQLYNTDISQYPVAAVLDEVMPARPELGIPKDGQCFNAGILLMNLPQWRSQRVSERAIAFLNEFPEKIQWVDQDALNAILIGNWYHLPTRYNLTFYNIPKKLKKKDIAAFLEDKVIIHYTTQHKPWILGCANRLRFLYEEYFDKSPRAKQPMYLDFKVPSLLRHTRTRFKEFLIDYTSLV